ncbi:MAG: protein translocase subunit SecF, partial [Terriglobus sp.]
MEFFRDSNIDWLSKKWLFLGFSLIFSVSGVLSMLFWHHIPVGIDFKGGTQVRVSFPTAPNEDHLRTAMDRAGIHDASIQRLNGANG